MAIVTKDSTAGVIAGGVINIGKPLQVSNGYNFPIIRAHQIGWGNSYFNSYAFSTSEELLTYIEQGINGGGQAYTLAYGAYLYADAAYTYTDNLANNKVVPHINDTDIHVSTADKTNWNDAAEKINTFIGSEDIEDTLDTLKEITYWLDNNPNDAAKLTVSLAELTTYTYNVVANKADAAYTWADKAYTWADDAYSYAVEVKAVAVNASEWADKAYSKAGEAYTYAGEAYTWADKAYTWADDAYSYAVEVKAVADNASEWADKAYSKACEAYTYAGEAYNYANLAYTYSYSVVAKEVDKAYTWAKKAYVEANYAVEYADGAYNNAKAAYTYTENLANHVVVPHINDTDIHIQTGERDKWDYAYTTIKTFIGSEDIEDTLDTLKEITYWLDNSGDGADLTVSLAGLTAYTYDVVAKQADKAYTTACDAYTRGDQAYTRGNEANTRASEAYTLAYTAYTLKITYSVTSTDATGYFLASVDVAKNEETNTYELKYTYAYVPSPKAEDYWAEYAIANSFNGYVRNQYGNIEFNDVYGTDNSFKCDVYLDLGALKSSTILELTADNIETSYYQFAINNVLVDSYYVLAETLNVSVTDNKCVFTAKEGFTNAILNVSLRDGNDGLKTLTSAYFEINIVGSPT